MNLMDIKCPPMQLIHKLGEYGGSYESLTVVSCLAEHNYINDSKHITVAHEQNDLNKRIESETISKVTTSE